MVGPGRCRCTRSRARRSSRASRRSGRPGTSPRAAAGTDEDLAERHASPTCRSRSSPGCSVWSVVCSCFGMARRSVERQAEGLLDQPGDLQPIVGEVSGQELLIRVVVPLGLRIGRDRRIAVDRGNRARSCPRASSAPRRCRCRNVFADRVDHVRRAPLCVARRATGARRRLAATLHQRPPAATIPSPSAGGQDLPVGVAPRPGPSCPSRWANAVDDDHRACGRRRTRGTPQARGNAGSAPTAGRRNSRTYQGKRARDRRRHAPARSAIIERGQDEDQCRNRRAAGAR